MLVINLTQSRLTPDAGITRRGKPRTKNMKPIKRRYFYNKELRLIQYIFHYESAINCFRKHWHESK